MSRTTRRPKFYIETSETKEIQLAVARATRNPYIRVRKTQEELDQHYQYMLKNYPEYAHMHYRATRGYKQVKIEVDIDAVTEKAKREFATYTRDGKWNETGRNTGFKQAAAKCVRLANKQFCGAVIRGEDIDNKIYPHNHLGDYLVWSFW
jgi:hypothetical protein